MSTNNNAAESAGQIEQVYTKVKLYGGAVTADLPNEFSDVRYVKFSAETGLLSGRTKLSQKLHSRCT